MNSILKKLFLIVTLSCSSFAFAIDWTGNSEANDNWGNIINWDGAVPNSAGAYAVFPNTLPFGGTRVDLDISPTVGNLDIYKDGPMLNQVGIYSVGDNDLVVRRRIALFGNQSYLRLSTDVDFTNNADIYLYTGTNYPTVYSLNSNLYFPTGAGVSNVIGPGTFLCSQNSISGNIHVLGGANTNLVFNDCTFTNTNFNLRAQDVSLSFENGTSTISANITGSGDVTVGVLAGGVVTLSGTNDFTGTLSLNGVGTIAGTTTSLPSSVNSGGITVDENVNLRFDQTTSGTCSNVISGAGSFAKEENGTLTLAATNTYTGNTDINGGTLSITGSISDSTLTMVDGGATLTGSGSVGNLISEGNVIAGTSSNNNLTVNGTYTQENAGTFKSLLSPNSASRLIVTGEASLSGALQLELSPGVYQGGTTFTVLDADSITGDFTSFNDGDPNNVWAKTLDVLLATVSVSLPRGSSIVVTPVDLSNLQGNARIVGRYMFADANFVSSNNDLLAVSNIMTSLSDVDFENSLIRVSPLPTAALTQASFQNNIQMAVVLDKQFQKNYKKKASLNNSIFDAPCSIVPKTGLFIEPIGVFYHQRSTDGAYTVNGQVGFQSYTYGAGLGWEQVLDEKFVVEGGVGYTHSNLVWDDQFGNSKWSTIYLAPFFGYFNKRSYANFMVMGAINFFNTDRKIIFTGFERIAESRYKSYDLLLRANGGLLFPFGGGFWLQPDATVNFLTIFRNKYTESGAQSINLVNQSDINYILQPSFRAKLVKEFYSNKFCYAPNIYVGWLANVLLKSQTLSARFKEAPNQIFFTIEGYYKTRNQLVVGGEFFAERFGMFNLSVNFEADLLSEFEVYTAKLKFECLF